MPLLELLRAVEEHVSAKVTESGGEDGDQRILPCPLVPATVRYRCLSLLMSHAPITATIGSTTHTPNHTYQECRR